MGRPLTAGFHLMQGYFRDDQPLCELILDEGQRRQIDALWDELNVITLAPVRQYRDFIFFERAEPPRFMHDAEFDFARSEDRDATGEQCPGNDFRSMAATVSVPSGKHILRLWGRWQLRPTDDSSASAETKWRICSAAT